MEITKSQKRLFIILGLVIIYFIYDIVSDWETYAGFYSGEKVAVQQVDNKSQIKAEQNLKKEQDKQYLEKWGRNPFYKKIEKKKAVRVVKKTKTVNFKLHAVSMKDNNSVALINDKIVKIGDMISGYTLKKINKKQVILSDGQKTITLKLDTY